MAHQTLPGDGAALRRGRGRQASKHRWAGCGAFAAFCLTLALSAGPMARGQSPNPAVRTPGSAATIIAQAPAPGGQPKATGDPLPAPRRTDDIGIAHPRLQGLAASVPPPIGTTPVPTKEIIDKFAKYIGSIQDPDNTLDLVVGRPRLINLKESPFRVQVADERTMTWNLLTPRELSIVGSAVGSTILNLWFGDPNEATKQTVLSYLVHVLPDPEAKERMERVYKALEEEINKAFPDDYVCLFLVGDKLVVTGEAKDSYEASKIMQIVASGGGTTPQSQIPVSQINLNLSAGELGPDGLPPQALESFLLSGTSNIVNLLRVPGEQQVMLKVTVAEMNRSAARSIGVNFLAQNQNANWAVSQLTGNLFGNQNGGGGGGGGGGGANGNQGGANLLTMFSTGDINWNMALAALRTINMARTLAEPNLVTLNGQPAYFQSGGQFPVPVITGATATGLQGVSYIPFGVQLTFTPTITDKDRIRMSLNAVVSVRSEALGANFGGGSGGAGGSGFVAGLNSRTVSTTVELRDGQTLAIGGLLQSNLGGDRSSVPLLGDDLWFIGNFFRVNRTSAQEQELVVLVTPQIVRPMEPKEVPPLPGSDYFEAGDLEFYLLGRLESRRAYDYRSPVMTTIGRMAAYRHCESLYFIGPSGHSDHKESKP